MTAPYLLIAYHDPEKLQPLIGEISWTNHLIMARCRDDLEREFYLRTYQDAAKVQPLVAQIGWSHNVVILHRSTSLHAKNSHHWCEKIGWSHNAKVSPRLGVRGSGLLAE